MQDEPSISRMSRRTLIGAAAAGVLGFAASQLPEPAIAWGGYSNGYIPLTAMTKVNYPGVSYWSWSSNPADGAVGGVYMEAAAANALVAMLSAYHSQVGGYLKVNEGYRSYAGQVYWANNGSGGTPGLSNHGWGQAFDFDPSWLTPAQHSWVLAHCGQFGYAKLGSGVFGQFDWMHFNYTGAATGPTIEHPVQQEEDDMQLISVFADNGNNWGGNYGSTAVITAHRGFVQTSTGLGPRNELDAWLAIAGVLGYQIIEKHVDSNGFEMAKRL